jgi:hypothetical protein
LDAASCNAVPKKFSPRTPSSNLFPTPQEVAPWVAVIEQLWDDPEFEGRHRDRARLEARHWDGEVLAQKNESFLTVVG